MKSFSVQMRPDYYPTNMPSTNTILYVVCFVYLPAIFPQLVDNAGLYSYLHTLLRSSQATWSSLILSLILLKRWSSKNRHRETQHVDQALVAALMLASKSHFEPGYKNSAWASITGISVSQLNSLESDFLGHIDYQLHVTVPEFKLMASYIHGCNKPVMH